MESNTPPAPQQLDDWFISLLACPGCEQHHPVLLSADNLSLICACGKYSFPITDGIPVLLMESATLLDAAADPASLQQTAERGESS